MDELSLYESILQLKYPWSVETVSLEKQDNQIIVHVVRSPSEPLTCPTCSKTAPGYDHRPRQWRHLDTCQYKTIVQADVPRVNCPEHGCLTIEVPWAEERARFTTLFECVLIDWLKDTSISAVCRHFKISWNAADGVMRRAVARGVNRRQLKPPTHICVDEVSVKKGRIYMTIVSSPEGEVLHVAKDRSGDSLNSYYETLSDADKTNLAVISMDMSPAYLSKTLEVIPEAKKKVAFDRFHVAQSINHAVDLVRKQEARTYYAELKESGLLGNRFLWLKGSDKLTAKQKKALRAMSCIANKTGRAWMLKEHAKQLWDYETRGWAERGWQRWYLRAVRSRLKPFKRVAASIKKNLWGIINAIVLNANNGIAESINSKIKLLKSRARGFRNSERFKTAVMFYCGKLDLYPATHSNE